MSYKEYVENKIISKFQKYFSNSKPLIKSYEQSNDANLSVWALRICTSRYSTTIEGTYSKNTDNIGIYDIDTL